jgi:hypothetical protein
MKTLLLLSTCAVALAACGGGGTTDGGTDAGTSATDAGFTNISMSGARTSTFVAIAPSAQLNVQANSGEVSLITDGPVEHAEFNFVFPGEPMVTTYVPNDAGIDCNVIVYLPPPSLDGWMANHGGGLAEVGTCSLTLSSVVLKSDVTTQRRYTVHGATMPARSGNATGTITFSANF